MKEVTNVEKTGYRRSIDRGTKIEITTDDDMMYIFWDLPWFNYPVYSHRTKIKDYSRKTDSRNFPLPDEVEKLIWDEYEGYYMADGQVVIDEEEKSSYTIIRPKVGDMYPLREP